MANYPTAIPLSNAPEMAHNSESHPPQNTRNNNQQPQAPQRANHDEGEVPRRPKGRPLGSKNKPKPPIIITRESEPSLKQHVLQIPTGCDVIEALIGFACRLNVGITVLSGVGTVSRATLCDSVPPRRSFTLDGPLNILSLNGSIVAAILQPSSSLSSCRTFTGVFPSCSAFTISVSGADGHVLGGIVAGSVLAASTVTVMFCTFADPMFYRLPCGSEIAERGQPSSNDAASAAPACSPSIPGDAKGMRWGLALSHPH